MPTTGVKLLSPAALLIGLSLCSAQPLQLRGNRASIPGGQSGALLARPQRQVDVYACHAFCVEVLLLASARGAAVASRRGVNLVGAGAAWAAVQP